MTAASGQPPGSGGGSGKKPARPSKIVRASDEFELDIDVDTDLTRVAGSEPAPSLFDDDDEEETQEVSLEYLEARPGQDEELDQEMPAPPDLSSLLEDAAGEPPAGPASDRESAGVDELFGDLAVIHYKPPAPERDVPQPAVPSPRGRKRKKRFGTGMTGTRPLDIGQFETPDPALVERSGR